MGEEVDTGAISDPERRRNHGGSQSKDAPDKHSVSLPQSDSPGPASFPATAPPPPKAAAQDFMETPFVLRSPCWFHSQQTLPIYEPALNDNHFPQD